MQIQPSLIPDMFFQCSRLPKNAMWGYSKFIPRMLDGKGLGKNLIKKFSESKG